MGLKDNQLQQSQEAQNIFRVGEISSTNPEKGTVRVKFQDADKLVSFDLPTLFGSTLKDRKYKMPDVGEQVACLFQPNGLETGVVLGCMYNAKDKPPANNQDIDHVTYEDGTVIEYDRKNHKLTANVKGDIDVTADGNITITAGGKIDLTAGGPVTIKGASINLN